MLLIVYSDKSHDASARKCFDEIGMTDISFAHSAEKARNFIDEAGKDVMNKITLIIIDSKLTDIDGFEFCRELKKTEVGKNAYVIILISSLENKTAIEKTRHSGADDYAVKPYHSAEFKKNFVRYMMKRVVVLVDDDPLIIQMVKVILLKYNAEILTFDDGAVAHNKINSMLPVSLVLLDIGLPNINGIKIIKSIRSKSLWRKTPVIMITGSTDANNVKDSLSSGANDYIVKPFKVDDFMSRISRYIGNAD